MFFFFFWALSPEVTLVQKLIYTEPRDVDLLKGEEILRCFGCNIRKENNLLLSDWLIDRPYSVYGN